MSQTLVNGVWLTGAERVHRDYLDAMKRGPRNPYMAELFEGSIARRATVVDAGAFLGYWTLLAASRVGSRGRVYAFEPNPVAFSCLRRNLRLNSHKARLFTVPAALAEHGGWSHFYLADGSGAESGLSRPDGVAERVRIETTTLDRVIGDRSVDVMKLNVSGGELDVLKGMKRVIAASPDLRLFVECDRMALARAGTPVGALLHELRISGFSVGMINEARRQIVPLAPEPSKMPQFVNLYCEVKSAAAQKRPRRRRRRRLAGRGAARTERDFSIIPPSTKITEPAG